MLPRVIGPAGGLPTDRAGGLLPDVRFGLLPMRKQRRREACVRAAR
jgi:hypothetical protein